MEVVFIGTGCGVPSNQRSSPCILIRVGKDNLLFDTGPGSLRKLFEAGFTYKDIGYLLYTHFHVDHIADLAPFLFASKYTENLREKDLYIIGPKGIKRFYQKLLNLYGEQIQSLHYNVKLIDENKFSTSNWKISTVSLPHTPESIGYRVTDRRKRVIVYSGDTEYSATLVELARGSDLLILECSFPVSTPGHLYPGLAGRIAKEAGAKQLILTHLYPICEPYDLLSPIRAEFSGKVAIAQDLMRVKV
ncbi:MAG: MBL fold metallo-hydrolase [bacterium]|nr:MBL fold metallo-hydrolase [bacterium]